MKKTKVLATLLFRPHNITGPAKYTKSIEWDMYYPAADSFKLVPSLNMKANISSMLFMAKTFLRFLKFRPDVAICNAPWVSPLFLVYCRVFRAKLIIRTGADVKKEIGTQVKLVGELKGKNKAKVNNLKFKLMMWALKHCDGIITVSEDARAGLYPEKNYCIPTPCDIARYDLVKPYKDRNDKKVILAVTNGNFRDKIEALYPVLEVINGMLKKRSDFEFVIIGGGLLYEEFRNTVKKTYYHRYRRSIIVAPYSTELEKYYQIADISLYYSNHDVCPNAVLETWASRTPLVIGDAYWINSVVPRHTAVVVGDIDRLETTLCDLLDNPARAADMVNDGWDYVRKYHSYQACGELLEDCIKEVISNGRYK